MNPQKTIIAILATLSAASLTLADDFKTIKGKEYKNVTVSRVEPDGIMVESKSGILKLYFVELPKEVQERFNYNLEKAAVYSAELQARNQQQEAEARQKQALMRDQNERAAKVEAAIANGETLIGMTGEECIRAWGRPLKVYATDTARGNQSQWVYPVGRHLNFENGILTSIQYR